MVDRTTILDIQDWDIDNLAASQAARLLSSRFVTSRIQLPPEWVLNRKLFWTRDPLPPESAPQGIDAYLLIHPAEFDGNPAQVHGGRGLGFAWSDSFLLELGLECANYEIELVNAKTGKTIAHEHSLLKESWRNEEAIEKVDKGRWPNDKYEFSSDQLNLLRADYRELVAHTLTETLQQMGLTGQAP